jgi:nucleoside-diphosphate-sugar epimerase
MRILILGGTHFIGAATTRWLKEMGHTVAVFHRGQTRANIPPDVRDIKVASADLIRREGLPTFRETFVDFGPDVVVDMMLMLQSDAQITAQLMREITRRLVVISSADVYRAYGRFIETEPGEPTPTPLTEESPLREKYYPYRHELLSGDWQEDYDKILVENSVLNDPALPTTILRLPMVYGPHDSQHRLFSYIKRMIDKRPYIILDEAVGTWKSSRGYVDDMGYAIALAVADERAAGQIYNVAESIAFTEADWIRQIGATIGWQGQIITMPREKLPNAIQLQGNFAQHFDVDSSHIRRDIGYREQTPSLTALEQTITWERAYPPTPIDPHQFDYAAEDQLLAKR